MGSQSISDLTEELLMEIFLRLRAKPVMRCKCVCKPWRTLRSDPTFIKLHLARSLLLSKPHNLFLAGYPFKTLDCGFLDDEDNNEDKSPKPVEYNNVDGVYRRGFFHCVLPSCNGLICLSVRKPKFLLYLLNPCTRELVQLPPDPLFHCEGYSQHVLQAFGYDHVADEYKVVRIKYKDEFNQGLPYHSEFLEVMVYTLGTPGWRRVQAATHTSRYRIPDYNEGNPMTHVNGVLHCLNLHPISKSIISFDLHTEKFGLIPLPDFDQIHEEGLNDTCYLSMLQGCLILEHRVTVLENADKPRGRQRSIDIWMMKSYGVKESWVIIFSLFGTSGAFDDLVTPLFVLKNGRIVLLSGDTKLLLYDPELTPLDLLPFFRKIG